MNTSGLSPNHRSFLRVGLQLAALLLTGLAAGCQAAACELDAEAPPAPTPAPTPTPTPAISTDGTPIDAVVEIIDASGYVARMEIGNLPAWIGNLSGALRAEGVEVLGEPIPATRYEGEPTADLIGRVLIATGRATPAGPAATRSRRSWRASSPRSRRRTTRPADRAFGRLSLTLYPPRVILRAPRTPTEGLETR